MESPKFIKNFSKENSSEERKKVAEEIRGKRISYFVGKRAQEERHVDLERNIAERENSLSEQLDLIKKLESEIDEISSSKLSKLLNYFKLKKYQADLAVGQKTYEELQANQNREISEKDDIFQKLESKEKPESLKEAEEILKQFYAEQEEKWRNSDYTKEDIKKNFSDENLSSLSVEDYALMLSRFPREMVAHVTRQGIRDHVGMVYHTAGAGSYADGFMKIVEDGRLRSPLGVYLVEKEKREAIARFLNLNNYSSKEEALNYLNNFTTSNQGDPGSYVDRMAVHFATDEVADHYYGSEKGNEIFIAYPSLYIASQYYFEGQLKDAGGGYWNDQWVWANEEKGMDLNSGLVFIPEDAMVDRNTGSRYELGEDKEPLRSDSYISVFKKVVDSPDFEDFAEQVCSLYRSVGRDELKKKLEPFRQKLIEEFQISDKRLQNAILGYESLFSISIKKKNRVPDDAPQFETIDSLIEHSLKEEGIFYTESSDTVSSKDFWEDYFAKNPSKKPSKIVYYKGGNPTKALWDWMKENKIKKRAESGDLGFPEMNVKRNSIEATKGMDRFRTLAEEVIDEYFAV